MPSTHFSANSVAGVGEERDRLQQVLGDQRDAHVELELALHTADGDRRVVADHLRGDLEHDLGDHRVDLARHDRGALLQLGQQQLADARARARAHQREVVGDLRERDGDDLERAGQLDERVAVALRLERVLGRADVEPGVGREPGAHALGEVAMGVEPGARGRTAERDLGDVRQRVGHPRPPEPDLRRVAGELLTERHGDRVHEVRAAGLDDVGELLRLGGERPLEPVERGQQPIGRLVERREVHGRGEHVVGRLAHVDVVVGVRAVAGQRRDDLVGVHVRRRARAGLEHVDRELPVVPAGRDRVGGLRDPLGERAVEQPELGVDARGGALDAPEPAQDRDRHRLARHGEVGDRLRRLAAPQLLGVLHAHRSRPPVSDSGG